MATVLKASLERSEDFSYVDSFEFGQHLDNNMEEGPAHVTCVIVACLLWKPLAKVCGYVYLKRKIQFHR